MQRMAPEKDGKEIPSLHLRIVEGDGSSGGSAPQISLEQILVLKKVQQKARMINQAVEAQHDSALVAMIEARIKAKAETAAKGKKGKVRVEFSRRFFSGEHRRMSRKAFEGVVYPEGLDEFKIYKEKIYHLYRNMQTVSVAANDMSKYLNGIKERKALEKRRKPKRKPSPAEKKIYFSETEESKIQEFIQKIFSGVETYNQAIVEFTSSLPDMGGAEKDPLFDEQRIADANLALEQIRSAPYDESLVQVASSAAKELHEMAESIGGIGIMIGNHINFSSIKWSSMSFGSYLAKRGFRVEEKPYFNSTSTVYAVGEIEIPEEPNPQP